MSDQNIAPIPGTDNDEFADLRELLPISNREIGTCLEVQTVDARRLHEWLQVKTRFNDWIKSRICDYGFVQDVDFSSFTEHSVKPQGGAPTVEYYLTLDTAKELAMVEKTDRGRLVRRYFIAAERENRMRYHNMTPGERIIEMGRQVVLIEREQARQAQQICDLREAQEKTHRLAQQTSVKCDEIHRLASIADAKANSPVQDFSIMAYAKICSMKVTLDDAKKLGALAKRLSIQRGTRMGRCLDPRFGYVNTYVDSVLEDAFHQYYGENSEGI